MKILVTGKTRLRPGRIICLLAVLLVLVALAVWIIKPDGGREAAVTATVPTLTNELTSAVTSSLDNYGAATAEQAVEIWAAGVCARNGMTQYSVMSDDLKGKYLSVTASNYGGMLFPDNGYKIDSWQLESMTEEDGYFATVRFSISGGVGVESAVAELKLAEDGEYVSIYSVAVESPLYGFTGIRAF